MSDTSQLQSSASPSREAETCSLHRVVRRARPLAERLLDQCVCGHTFEQHDWSGAAWNLRECRRQNCPCWHYRRSRKSTPNDQVMRPARRRTPGETLAFISEMCEHTESVEALSDIQLVECLREEITDQMPMNSRDFALIAEAETRLLK